MIGKDRKTSHLQMNQKKDLGWRELEVETNDREMDVQKWYKFVQGLHRRKNQIA
jgi:hypothetical protein